jgi:hypothetical protein
MIIRFQNLRGSEWFLVPHGNWIAVNAVKQFNLNKPEQKEQICKQFIIIHPAGNLMGGSRLCDALSFSLHRRWLSSPC